MRQPIKQASVSPFHHSNTWISTSLPFIEKMVNANVISFFLLITGAIVSCYALPSPKLDFKEFRHFSNSFDNAFKEPKKFIKKLSMVEDSVMTYVVGGMIISVPSSMSENPHLDILYSLLLAQLGSNKAYNRNSQVQQWLGKFCKTYFGMETSTPLVLYQWVELLLQ